MLKKLILRNFQVHKKLVIEFDPCLTTIIGASDVGKTAVIRALRWLCLNRPSGDQFITYGASHVKVILTLGTDRITRSKGIGKNTYRVGQSTFKAFGTQVPDRVQRSTKVGDKSFQLQHEAPFWFNLTPGQVSKELNQIVNLEVIDHTTGRISNLARRAKAAVELTQERLKAAREEKKKLAWTVEADTRLQSVQKLVATVDDISNRRAVLSDLISQASLLRTSKAKATERANTLRQLVALAEPLANPQSIGLGKLIDQIATAERDQCQAEQTLKQFEHKLSQVKVCPLCGQKLK